MPLSPWATFAPWLFLAPEPRKTTAAPEPFGEVELLRDERTRKGQDVPSGSRGTVVEVLGDHEAYMVEFVEPFAALVTVRSDGFRAA